MATRGRGFGTAAIDGDGAGAFGGCGGSSGRGANFGSGRGNLGGNDGEDSGSSFGGRGDGRGSFGGGRGSFGSAESESGGRRSGRGGLAGGRGNFGGNDAEDSGASFGGRGGGRGSFGGGRGSFGSAEGESAGRGGLAGGSGKFGGGRGNFGGNEGEDSGASFGGGGGAAAGRGGSSGGGRGSFGSAEGESAGRGSGRAGGRGNFGGAGNAGEDTAASFGGRGGSFAGGQGNFGSGNGNEESGPGFAGGRDGGSRGNFDGNRAFPGDANNNGEGGFKGPPGEGAPFPLDEDRPPAATYIPTIKEVDALFAEDEQNAVYSDVFDADEDVIVKGIDESKIVLCQTWADCNLPQQLHDNIVNRCKYARPRKIQSSVIPLVYQGYDVMGHAETGGGKTAAFMLPIIQKIMENPPADPMVRCCPVAIVIGPTRELVLQLSDQGRKFADKTNVSVAKAYGQYNVRENLREIRTGCDVLCATPGRLKHFITNNEIRFTNLKYFILDEADHLMETNFWDEIVQIVRMEGFPSTENRQTLLFSATFSDAVLSLANDIMRPTHRVMVSNKNTSGHACSKVKQHFISVPKFEKNNKILEILQKELDDEKEKLKKEGGDPEKAHVRRTLVFVQLKRTTDLVAGYLSSKGIMATSINGDRSQELRERALRDFREDRCHVLVATDVCARGIDIHDLEHVVNYDLPSDVTTYIHRIGRTGRLCEGTATSFVVPEGDATELCKDIVEVVRGVQQEAPQFLVDVAEGRRPGDVGGGGGFIDAEEPDNAGW